MKLLPVLLFVLTFASCGSSPDEEEESKIADQQIVGRIASVSKQGGFVLIQKFGPGPLPSGVLYQSRGPDNRSASLRPSGERIRDFFAADLLSGTVIKGDAVIAYPKEPEDEESGEKDEGDTGESTDSVEDDGTGTNNQETENIKEMD